MQFLRDEDCGGVENVSFAGQKVDGAPEDHGERMR